MPTDDICLFCSVLSGIHAQMVNKAAAMYDSGVSCGPEANMAKMLAADASWCVCVAYSVHGKSRTLIYSPCFLLVVATCGPCDYCTCYVHVHAEFMPHVVCTRATLHTYRMLVCTLCTPTCTHCTTFQIKTVSAQHKRKCREAADVCIQTHGGYVRDRFLGWHCVVFTCGHACIHTHTGTGLRKSSTSSASSARRACTRSRPSRPTSSSPSSLRRSSASPARTDEDWRVGW